MNRIELAQKLRPLIVEAAGKLDDKRLSEEPEAVHLCDTLHGDGRPIKAGTRINWNGTVKKAATDLWDRKDQWPDANPNGWEDLPYKNGIRIVPEVITSGLKFSKGEQGYWNDILYESTIDNNTWTPDGFPAGWKKVNT